MTSVRTGVLGRPAGRKGRPAGGTGRHAFGALASPTRADFRGRLEVGLGRWASLFPRVSKAEGAGPGWGWRP